MHFLKPKNNRLVLVVIAAISLITLASWNVPMTPGVLSKFFYISDTIPKKSDRKIIELDEAIAQLEKAKEELKDRDITAEIANAIKSINLDEIHNSVEDAVLQTKSALSKIDAKKIREDVTLALAKIDKDKIEEQVRAATANLQPQIQKSLDEVKRELEQARRELEAAKQRIRKEKILK